jgi:hypothetical protein
MKHGISCATVLPGIVLATSLQAAPPGPSRAMIGAAFKEILAAADTNRDGKLGMTECLTLSSNRAKIEKDCRYWDANGDGLITEAEYVQQARKRMR